jgi:hypothetical protein
MGAPEKLTLNGETVFVCCAACVKKAQSQPTQTLQVAKSFRQKMEQSKAPGDLKPLDPSIQAELGKLSAEDRKLAIAQRLCPIADDSPLGGMGVPVKVMLQGQPVFVCCDGCVDAALEKPTQTLARVKQLLTEKPASKTESKR